MALMNKKKFKLFDPMRDGKGVEKGEDTTPTLGRFFKLWKRKFWYRFVVVTMYFNAGIIPWYLTMDKLGMTNNFWGYIFPTIIQPFYIILCKTFCESVPRSATADTPPCTHSEA